MYTHTHTDRQINRVAGGIECNRIHRHAITDIMDRDADTQAGRQLEKQTHRHLVSDAE